MCPETKKKLKKLNKLVLNSKIIVSELQNLKSEFSEEQIRNFAYMWDKFDNLHAETDNLAKSK